MKTNESSSSVLLAGCVFLASLDFGGLIDYGMKALVGSGIWFGVKAFCDYRAEKKRQKAREAGK
jgi:hypothetical protein